MKNFQQTPKQRRVKLEEAKRMLRQSNPNRQFQQTHQDKGFKKHKGEYRWCYSTKNLVSYRGPKL